MSKMFEALQRMERESGGPLGVLPEIQQLLRDAIAGPSATPLDSASSPDIRPSLVRPADTNGLGSNGTVAEDVHKPFALDQVAVEEAVISPAIHLVYYSDPDSPGADRFRLLRMRLRRLWDSGKLKRLFVTSAQPQEGKSTAVLNLATAMVEQAQRRVLLIEGDLCHPSLSQKLGLQNKAGLAECLEANRNPLLLLRRIEPLGWYMLSAGDPQGNSTELLQSPRLSEVFEAVSPCFDWILIDTPPVIPLSDTLSLTHHSDAGLLVVRADRTPRDAVETAIARIGKERLLGLVLNGTEELDRQYSDYRKYYRVRERRSAGLEADKQAG